MKIVVLSDPHGDWVALRKVIADLERQEAVDDVLLGGDLAQGGAQPCEVVDEIRGRGWRSVRGNADDLIVRIADGGGEDALRHLQSELGPLPSKLVSRGRWTVKRLGPERIDYLRNLPVSIELVSAIGRVVLVHATPWSTEDVVLPDAGIETARRMIEASCARLLLYGHIHTPYQRRVDDAILASVGAVSGSNDLDSRPSYTMATITNRITVEVRRVDWPADERLADYMAAGVQPRFIRDTPGLLPIRSKPSEEAVVWP